ncbi:hypothetical protein M433DRAFT_154866 [Acidomyces richmondensis BFW]|nr:MAG: hypothetical protein FE78DRAFT_91248 [Acidomyces sp. 'richmondensis']KYG45134.1 hypothetical protein M433DRAFT_154866 [Acidomyces richmondensis BFW]
MAQPAWCAPPALPERIQEQLPPLSIYNSLTRSKTPFVPVDREGKKINWYACGPTVYDDAHLGHARNYVSTDIIRRVLEYLGFTVFFVMNITDVDDKIILAARQQHLLSLWLTTHETVDQEVRDTTKAALRAYLEKNLPLIKADVDPNVFAQHINEIYGHVLAGQSLDKQSQPGDKETKIKMYLSTATSACEALTMKDPSMALFVDKAAGVLLPYIDSLEKHTIEGRNHEIFARLTREKEKGFFEDMKDLNVRLPDRLTRVTEYGPQIVDFVKKIEDHGFAYEHEGSVYYDINAWETSGGVYARLEPWNRNDKELLQDGEGSLSTKKTGFKRSAADFALWKASKEGEPSWDSPWGPGRPGWHIECSAMASDVLGKQIDIHSGGIDLAFPHHDNELAQSEAYWAESGKESKQWVNYFLHMGHLSIQGSKMSKSLKNFTTIREALKKGDWTPRGLRIVFLLGSWRDGLEITGEVVKASKAWEEKVDNFFIKIRDIQQRVTTSECVNGVTYGVDNIILEDKPAFLLNTLASAKKAFDAALCDSFDTPTAMRVISDLITAYNSEKDVQDSVALELGRWVTDMVQMFGLDAERHEQGVIGWSGLEIPEEAKPFIYPLSQIRDKVRNQAKAGTLDFASFGNESVEKDIFHNEDKKYARALVDFQRKLIDLHSKGAAPKDYLAACDYVRDTVLWNMDIYLEDRENLPALIRPLSQSLREERQSREEVAAAKAAERERARAEKAAADQARLEAGKMSHLQMFRTSEYSSWDSEGMPTHDAEGKEVAKSRLKKLRKEYERQKKLHEAWLGSQVQ